MSPPDPNDQPVSLAQLAANYLSAAYTLSTAIFAGGAALVVVLTATWIFRENIPVLNQFFRPSEGVIIVGRPLDLYQAAPRQ